AGTVSLSGGNAIFTPAANFNGPVTFTYTAQLQGDSDPSHKSTGTVSLNVTAVNDAPTLTVPGAQTTAEDTAKAITGIVAADVDANDAATSPGVQMTLTAAHGNITVLTTSGAIVTGNGTGNVTITGLVADVNTDVAGLSYTPASNFSGSDSLSVNVN